MKYCTHCGAELNEEQVICVKCGCMVQNAKPIAPEKKPIHNGSLIWAIFNLICCCWPLGLVSLILTVQASNATEEESAKKLKLAKTFNIVGTVVGAIILGLYTFLQVLVMIAEMGAM